MIRPVRLIPSTPAPAARSSATFRRGSLHSLLTAALLAGAPALEATTYNLITTVDDAVANGNCTLREAIRAASTNTAVDACPAGGGNDAIVLLSGTYPFNGQEAVSGSGTLSITGATLDPLDVTIDLGGVGRFVSLTGGGTYTIAGIEFTDGKATGGAGGGGAIHADNVSLTLFKFRFVSNTAGDFAGALRYISDSVVPKLLTVRDGEFITNAVSASPPVFAGAGAALVSIFAGNDADFRDVVFFGNSATSGSASSGGLEIQASGTGSVATCIRCSFQINSAAASPGGSAIGGAVRLSAYDNAKLTFRDGRFLGNFTSGSASGTAVLHAAATSGATIDLDRLFIDANTGSGSQDVMLQAMTGGVVSMVDSQLTFGATSGLLTSAASGGNVHLGHLTIADYPGNGANFSGTASGPTLLQNSLITFNGGTDLVDTDGALSQTGNSIGGDPMFVNQPSGDYHLAPASPVIDFGTPGTSTLRLADLDHGTRQVGLATDIGCYEFDSLFADGFDVGDAGSWSSFVP